MPSASSYFGSAIFGRSTFGSAVGPPLISGIGVVPSQTTAIVSWTTSEGADSLVEYGPSAAYGLSTAVDSTLVVNHALTLSGLLPGRTYYYRITSADSAGNVATSPALAFATMALPPPPPTGQAIFVWIEPVTAIAHQLTAQPDLDIIQGRQNLHMPTVRINEDRLPGSGSAAGGARLRDHVYESREVDLPLFLHCPDYGTLWSRHQEISTWFRIRRDTSGRPIPGILQCTSPSGNVRQLFAVYAGGLHGVEGSGVSGPNYRRMILQLRASDPLWYASAATSLTFAMVAGPTFFTAPFLPMKLGLSVVSVAAPVFNPGDEVCWPLWQIVGPGVNPVLTNLSTGQTLSLTLTLSAGQSVTIDTRPGRKSITNDQTQAQLYSALSPGNATMWPLQPGNNSIQVQMGGATTASQVVLTFTPAYLGP